MQIKHKYLVSFKTPFTRKTGEDKVLDETLLLMKWQSVQSLGWSLGVDESSSSAGRGNPAGQHLPNSHSPAALMGMYRQFPLAFLLRGSYIAGLTT